MSSRKKNIASHKTKSKANRTGAVHHRAAVLSSVVHIASRLTSNRITSLVCLIMLPVVVLGFYPSSGGDYDIWFHLAYGRHYVENLTWTIDHTQFSWPVTVPDWKYVTWMASGLLYLAYLAGGIPGVFILQWVFYSLIFLMLLAFIRMAGQRVQIWHVLGILVMAVVHKLVGIFVKPEFFTTFFFTLVVGLFFLVRMRPEWSKLFYVFPVVFLIWVNSHGGFIIGMFTVTLILGLEAVSAFLHGVSSDKVVRRRLLWSLAGSYLVILVNPHGIFYHFDVLKYLLSEEYMGNAKWLFAYFPLWDYVFQSPMRNTNFNMAAQGLVLLACFFLFVVFLAWKRKRYIDFPIIILNGFFFFFSMNAARSVIYYPVIWFFSINYLFWRCDLQSYSRRINLIAFPSYIVFSAFIFYIAATMIDNKSWFGFELENSWPEKEVEYIMKHHLPGPLFNDYLIGGYMIWKMYPDYKVWIDPRWGPYAGQVLKDWFSIQDHFSSPEKLSAFHKRYPFKTALVHMAYGDIITLLMNNPEWRMAYFDKVAAVFIHVSVIPQLTQVAMNTSLNPDRYEELDNPSILFNLFVFYNNFGKFFSDQIRDIYARNVSDWYKFKDGQLQVMDIAIEQRWGKKEPAASGS